jgi:hypothetical protein
MHARPDHSCQTSGRSYLNYDSCLTETRVRMGYHIVWTVDWSSVSWNLERNQTCWSSTRRRPDMLLKLSDGCKLAQKLLDTIWDPDRMNTSSGRMMLVCLASGWDGTSSGRMEHWTDGRSDVMARSFGRLTGNLEFFWLVGRNNWHHSESGILVYSIFTLKWFCPNTEWGQNTNKLPLWPFWDKNHLTGLEIHSQLK